MGTEKASSKNGKTVADKVVNVIATYAEHHYNAINQRRGYESVSVEVMWHEDVTPSTRTHNAYFKIPSEHTDVNEEGQLTGRCEGIEDVYFHLPDCGAPYISFVDGCFLDFIPPQQVYHHKGEFIYPLHEDATKENLDNFIIEVMSILDLIIFDGDYVPD